MKKLAKILAGLLAISMIFLFGFAIIKFINKEKVTTYHRFQVNSEKRFNAWGLISPLQTESQKLIRDTIRFSHKVNYPLGPHFKLVPPSDTSAESFVAKKMSDVIKDSVERIMLNLSLDYDGQSKRVREAQNPPILTIRKPEIYLWTMGTASPEAGKYGFEKSLQPGNVEEENLLLAKERLTRTDSLILKNLQDSGIQNVKIISEKHKELQLHSTKEANYVMANRSALDTMRYVKADVIILTERVEITPSTAPIGLWFFALVGLFIFALLRKIKFGGFAGISWKDIWQLLGIIIFVVILGICLYLIEKYLDPTKFVWLIIAIACIIVIAFLCLLLWILITNWKEFIFFLWALLQGLWWLIRLIVLGIMMALLLCLSLALMLLAFVVLLIVFVGAILIISWQEANWWQRTLVLHLILDIIALVAWLMGIWAPTFL